MDTPETNEEDEKNEKTEVPRTPWFRIFALIIFFLVAVVSSSLLLGVAVLVASNLSIPNPISVPSRCTVVSRSIDLRSSKVCELGLLNYNAKHVFYPSERKKFRCRHDYYWASIFKVEYIDRSGQTKVALAEAPSEALPLECRPSFGVAWLTKDKFMVNQTYDCWYTYDLHKVKIHNDSLFNCQAKDPSAVEMLRRYFILLMREYQAWYDNKRKRNARYWQWGAIAGVVTGSLTSVLSIALFRILHQLMTCLPENRVIRLPHSLAARLKKVCVFVAYFSFMGWLTLQYGRMLGLPEIFKI